MTESIRPPASLHYPKCRAVDAGQNIWLVTFLSCLSLSSHPFLSLLCPHLFLYVSICFPSCSSCLPIRIYYTFFLLFYIVAFISFPPLSSLSPLLTSPLSPQFSVLHGFLLSFCLLSFLPSHLSLPVFSMFSILFPVASNPLLVSSLLSFYTDLVSFAVLFLFSCPFLLLSSVSLLSPLYICILAMYSITLGLITSLKCNTEGANGYLVFKGNLSASCLRYCRLSQLQFCLPAFRSGCPTLVLAGVCCEEQRGEGGGFL